jgi:hypothetical protein
MQVDNVVPPKPQPGSAHRGDREAVRTVVSYLWASMWERDWPGMRGLSAWSAYKSLLWLAWRCGALRGPDGQPLAAGLRISLSMRQWAELAGFSLATVNEARKWLERERLIRRDGRGSGPDSGAFVLLVGVAQLETLTNEYHRRKEVSPRTLECFKLWRLSLRWGTGRLGKTKEALIHALHHLGGSATDREVATIIRRQKRVGFIRKHLDELERDRILKRSGNHYSFHPNHWIELVATRAVNGELEADERDKARYQAQREHYQWLLKTGKNKRSPNRSSAGGRRGAT